MIYNNQFDLKKWENKNKSNEKYLFELKIDGKKQIINHPGIIHTLKLLDRDHKTRILWSYEDCVFDIDEYYKLYKDFSNSGVLVRRHVDFWTTYHITFNEWFPTNHNVFFGAPVRDDYGDKLYSILVNYNYRGRIKYDKQ